MNAQARHFSCLAFICLSITSATLVRGVEQEFAGAPAQQFAALTKEFESLPPGAAPEDFYPRFLALAEKYPDDTIAIDALAWVANHPGNKPRDEAAIRRPFEILLRDHLSSDRLPDAFDNADDDFLRTVMEKSPHREVRGLAAFTLAEHQIWRIRQVRRYRDANPGWQISKLWLLAVPGMRYLVALNPDEVTKEVESLLQQVVQDYGNIPIADRRNGKTLGELARNHLHEIHDLGIGQVMPDLKSVDLDGKGVSLDDLKGKVVVLDVWATWCGSCRSMIADERELVKRLADKPFALVSISIDDTPQTVADFLTKESMPWTHWYNGPLGSLIADLNAYSYPTIYVLDARGIIRYKDIRGKLLDQAVDTMLKELERSQ